MKLNSHQRIFLIICAVKIIKLVYCQWIPLTYNIFTINQFLYVILTRRSYQFFMHNLLLLDLWKRQPSWSRLNKENLAYENTILPLHYFLLFDWLSQYPTPMGRGVKRAKRKRNMMFRFTFRLSHIKKIVFYISFERNVAKYFIFVKIALERKKFRLRSTFRCSNVTKNRCVLHFIRTKRDVKTSKY
jgi:hypothetical protein